MQKKGPIGPVGIKNSWKYEKDLIILNVIQACFTINQVSNFSSILDSLVGEFLCYVQSSLNQRISVFLALNATIQS